MYSKPNVAFFETKGKTTIRVVQLMNEWLVETFKTNENGTFSFADNEPTRFDDSAEAVEFAGKLLNA